MVHDLQKLRRAVADARRRGRGPRFQYSADLRRRVVLAASAHREAGRSVTAMAAEVGLDARTLRAWVDGGSSVFREVRVEPVADAAPVPAGLVLVTPGGYRVEGLALADVVSVLRALA